MMKTCVLMLQVRHCKQGSAIFDCLVTDCHCVTDVLLLFFIIIFFLILLYAYLFCIALWSEFQEYALYKNRYIIITMILPCCSHVIFFVQDDDAVTTSEVGEVSVVSLDLYNHYLRSCVTLRLLPTQIKGLVLLKRSSQFDSLYTSTSGFVFTLQLWFTQKYSDYNNNIGRNGSCLTWLATS